MIKKTSESVTVSNIISEGVSIIGVIFSTLLSFLITIACALSDYSQIFVLLDATQNESSFTVVIGTLTICIFLDFSIYAAGTVIKKLQSGRPLGGSTAISVVSIVLAFILFGVVFALSFKFKYALRDHLYSLDSLGGVDMVINKAVKAGSEVINNVSSVDISEAEITKISAILAGMMPAMTSLLSLVAVFLFYHPLENEKAIAKMKLMFYKYRYYKTQKQLTVVESEIFQYEQLPLIYGEVIKNDYIAYTEYCRETISAEHTAKAAEYTAAIEIFKADQNTVTQLSSEASAIRCRPQQCFDNTDVTELPDELLNQIGAAEKLFDKRKSGIDTSSSTPVTLTEEAEDTWEPEIPDLPPSVVNTQNDDLNAGFNDDDEPDPVASDVQPLITINIPDSMVSPQLNQSVNK